MNKLCLIVTNSHASNLGSPIRWQNVLACAVLCLTSVTCCHAFGQDDTAKKDGAKSAAKAEVESEVEAVVTYPRDVAVDGGALLVVDLDLPGIWKIDGDKQSLYVRGTKFLRKPMNRPWCVVPHPDGG
ncbi:MAG: hypothetical protein WBD20_11995, partial [Pirellulaceae bacterium]